MVPNKLVYSGIFFLEHERVYTRLLGRPEYVLLLLLHLISHCKKISNCVQKFNFQKNSKIVNLNFRA